MDTKRIRAAHEDRWLVGLNEHPIAIGLSSPARLHSSLSSSGLEERPLPWAERPSEWRVRGSRDRPFLAHSRRYGMTRSSAAPTDGGICFAMSSGERSRNGFSEGDSKPKISRPFDRGNEAM